MQTVITIVLSALLACVAVTLLDNGSVENEASLVSGQEVIESQAG